MKPGHLKELVYLLFLAGGLVLLWFLNKPALQTDYVTWQGQRAFEKAAFGDAEVAFRKAASLQRFCNLNYELGNSLYRQGRLTEAIKAYRAYLAIPGSGHAAAWFNAGNACFATGDTLQSLEAFTAALVLAPEDLQTRQNFLFVWRLRQKQLQREKPKAAAPRPENAGDQASETRRNQEQGEKEKPGAEKPGSKAELTDKNVADLLSQLQKNEAAARNRINSSRYRHPKTAPGELDY